MDLKKNITTDLKILQKHLGQLKNEAKENRELLRIHQNRLDALIKSTQDLKTTLHKTKDLLEE